MCGEKLVLFGIGQRYKDIREKYASFFQKLNVIAYLDNNEQLWGNCLDGVPVMSPLSVQTLTYDKIVLMTAYVKDIKEQLAGLGVSSARIVSWDEFYCADKHGVFLEYGEKFTPHNQKRKLLLISIKLEYNGGTFAAVYAAAALMMQGYDVTVAASEGNSEFIQEAVKNHIRIVIIPSFPFLQEEEKAWIGQFDLVIVNVFQMIRCACSVSQYKPVIWWIHEPGDGYTDYYSVTRDNYPEYDNAAAMRKINIVAVSSVAKKNFNDYYRDRIKEILPFGIPDKCCHKRKVIHEKTVFAIVGSVIPVKAQMIFMDAALMLNEDIEGNVEFWIIGNRGNSSYEEEVLKKAEGISNITFMGVLTQKQMQEKYEEMDVVVCSSMEETMSMTVMEGMMHEKICITTDATGIADYIEDEVNGLVCQAGNAQSLYQKMKWVTDNPVKCDGIRKNARSTYEQFFTLEKFGQRFQEVIRSTMEGKYGEDT